MGLLNLFIEFQIDTTRCITHVEDEQSVQICACFDKDFCNYGLGRSITASFFVWLLKEILM
jgi:hypothetical protein